MPDFLAPNADSLAKFETTWGILILVGSILLALWIGSKFIALHFELKERLEVLIKRTEYLKQHGSGTEQFCKELQEIVQNDAAAGKTEVSALMKEMCFRLLEKVDGLSEKTLEAFSDTARVQVLQKKMTIFKSYFGLVMLVCFIGACIGVRFTQIGLSEWRAAEQRALNAPAMRAK